MFQKCTQEGGWVSCEICVMLDDAAFVVRACGLCERTMTAATADACIVPASVAGGGLDMEAGGGVKVDGGEGGLIAEK